jgi:hypothetical protein
MRPANGAIACRAGSQPGDPMQDREPDSFAFRVLLILLAAAAACALSARADEPDPVPPGFRYWDPADTTAVPRVLSATGLYAIAPGKDAKLVPEARYYEVNAPFWSDDAKKKRWVLLKPGRQIGFREKDDYWDYPDSAVFVKEFAIDTVPGDAKSRVLWETRILVNRKDTIDPNGATMDRWYGFSYRWREDQKDADLVNLRMGMDDSIRIWPEGTGAGKMSAMKKWHFPNIYSCVHCHRTDSSGTSHGRSVLGFFTAQLNRPDPDSAGMNQLDGLFAKGVLKGTRPFAWEYAPRWRGLDDGTASLDVRARSYIAANCSGCHGARGVEVGATMGIYLNYDFHEMVPRMEFRNCAMTWPWGLDTVAPVFYPKNAPDNPQHLDTLRIEPALVVPGYPEKSVLLFRQKVRNTRPGNYDADRNQMPPGGSYEPDGAAIALMEKWIREMPSPVVALRAARPASANDARLEDRRLILSVGFAPGNVEVTLSALDGRRVEVRRLAAGVYAIPPGLPKGLYLIRAGSRSALRYLL